MSNFFSRFFGGGERAEPVPAPVVDTKHEEFELSRARERNFRKALDEYRGKPATDDEFLMVLDELKDGDMSRPFPRLIGEEIRAEIAKIVQRFGWSPELVLVGDVYTPMGNRQGNFEKALAKNLGRALTQDDLEDARAMFEGDQKVRAEWNTMFGHQVEKYAANIAARIQRDRLRSVKRMA